MTGERVAVAALVLFAALRVSCMAASFPFFTNVDEHRHVDMVLKYARGALPGRGPSSYESVMPYLVARLGAPDYQLAPGPPHDAQPGWNVGKAELQGRVERNEALFNRLVNLDAFQSPTYYATAGAWLSLARGLGLGSERALYAVRLLNGTFAGLLVWCAWALLRRTHPADAVVRRGVPALLACFPQDALYYVTPDALSPLIGAAAFAGTLRLALAPEARARSYAVAGLASAAAFLTKLPNLYVPVLAAGAALRDLRRGAAVRRGYALYAAAFALPVGSWLLRNQLLQGEALATGSKVELLGWRPNPVSAWLSHPLFTPSGFASFIGDLVPRFWRGELVWRRYELAWPPADAIYTATSLIFLALAAAALPRRPRGDARTVEIASAASIALSVAILFVLSLRFVFPEHGNPSAAHPWFFHGRLIAGALLPFGLLYVRGLCVLTSALPQRLRVPASAAALAAICGLALGSELWLSLPVFGSAYNFWHLP
ncbi:MAG TPA: hypothetical protein VFY49_19335 [Myxococcota bacterium]|nr:hypothetical protein [Myxococcota bacterium]